MGQVSISGALIGGPPPGAGMAQGRSVINVALALRGGNLAKPYNVASGVLPLALNSASSFAALPAIGSTVAKCDTLYFYAASPVDIRLTTDDGVGGDVVATVPVDGLVMLEFPSAKFLKLLEAKGSAQIEFFASGQS